MSDAREQAFEAWYRDPPVLDWHSAFDAGWDAHAAHVVAAAQAAWSAALDAPRTVTDLRETEWLNEQLAAARQAGAEASGTLLIDACRALVSFSLRALTVKPTLDTPYTDDPHWSPWTRWIEPEARRAHDLGQRIREHLREHGVTPPKGPHGAAPGVWPELPTEIERAAARIAALEDLVTDMLSRFVKTDGGCRARVGQVQIGKWQTIADGTASDA